jgi:hypothetical protein
VAIAPQLAAGHDLAVAEEVGGLVRALAREGVLLAVDDGHEDLAAAQIDRLHVAFLELAGGGDREVSYAH